MPLLWGTSQLRSTRPNLKPLLATRCLYQGGTSEIRSTRPNLVPLLTMRCLYQGVHLTSAQADPTLYQSWLLDASTVGYISAQVNQTQLSTTLDHEMPLPGGTSYLSSTRPSLVPLLATRCLYQGVHLTSGQADPTLYQSWLLDASPVGYISAQVNQTQLSTTLGH